MLLQLLSLEYDPRIGSLENGQIALLCALWSHIYPTQLERFQSAQKQEINMVEMKRPNCSTTLHGVKLNRQFGIENTDFRIFISPLVYWFQLLIIIIK